MRIISTKAATAYFVIDAFPAIHRSQTSLVGFHRMKPNIAGKLVEREVIMLDINSPINPITNEIIGVSLRYYFTRLISIFLPDFTIFLSSLSVMVSAVS